MVRRSRARYDWVNGTITQAVIGSAGAQLNINLWSPTTLGVRTTIMRIVGEIHVGSDPDDFSSDTSGGGHIDNTLYAGIQVVNRVIGSGGVARDPANADDREGREWMWLKSWRNAYIIKDGTQEPPDWFMPFSDVGGQMAHVDIRVKRIIDRSQDELLLSFMQVNRLASGTCATDTWAISANLRMLLLSA